MGDLHDGPGLALPLPADGVDAGPPVGGGVEEFPALHHKKALLFCEFVLSDLSILLFIAYSSRNLTILPFYYTTIGSEKQSEELVMYLMNEFDEDPKKIWSSNIFGKSLHELVNEGLHNKLYKMPVDARLKLQETLERIINEGCGGLICFIL